MKDAMAFLQALQTDSRAKELIKTMDIPADREKAADCYVILAGKLGYTLTKEEILAAAQEMSKAQREKTGRAMEKMPLDDEDLANVAGGVQEPGYDGCDSTYHDDEWCWISDSCQVLISFYEDEFFFVEKEFDLRDEKEFSPDEILNNAQHCLKGALIFQDDD